MLNMPTLDAQSVIAAYATGGKGLFRITGPIQKADPSSKHRRRIAGVASTPDRDLQDEIVRTEGLDVSYFVKSGWFNFNHSHSPGDLIGYPEFAKASEDELFVEGYLLENHKKADEVWELLNSLELSKADRQLGMSIEGVVTERFLREVKKALVRNVAITHCPINQSTYVDIVKAMGIVSKSLSTISGAPLRLESLDFGPFATVLFQVKCGRKCFDSNGRFRKGLEGAYAHLTECSGFPKKESLHFLKYFAKGISKNIIHPAWVAALGFTSKKKEEN